MSEPPPAGLAARLVRSARKHGVPGSLRVLAALGTVGALLLLSHPTRLAVAVGTPIVLFGELWRLWAAGHLLKSRELAVSGPYRHVQNPLYFGRLCLLVGFGLMATMPVEWGGRALPLNALVLAAMLAVFFGYYLPRKQRVEGARLARLHGEAWARWAAAVPAILPSPRAWGANVRGWSRQRFRENSEGWMLGFVLAVTAAFWARALAAG